MLSTLERRVINVLSLLQLCSLNNNDNNAVLSCTCSVVLCYYYSCALSLVKVCHVMVDTAVLLITLSHVIITVIKVVPSYCRSIIVVPASYISTAALCY